MAKLILVSIFFYFGFSFAQNNAVSSNTSSSDKFDTIDGYLFGTIVRQGLIEPFTNFSDGQTFEPSAGYIVGDQVFLINDRPLPAAFPSPVIKFNKHNLSNELIPAKSITPVIFPLMRDTRKIEAATQSFDKNIVFASSSFTYFEQTEPEKDRYNNILYWRTNKPNEAKLFNTSLRNGIRSSVKLRNQIQKVLRDSRYPEGPTYFKIEGLAYMPGDKLAFGIRSMGSDYGNANYQFIIITADLHSIGTKKELTMRLSNFELLYKQDAGHELKYRAFVKQDIGVSSIEYDQQRHGLFILTTYEDKKNGIGAYLWFYPTGKSPQLVFDKNHKPLVFKHKAEGLVIMDKNTLLVIHDDDREQLTVDTGRSLVIRKTNQGLFSIVKLNY